jgi:glycosyltransferase involved in cell wall biosynthesis
MKMPVIINNRDLLTWPKNMVKRLQQFKGIGDIIIIDNGSTYPPLLEWYKTEPCQIIHIDNIGHQAPWISGLIRSLDADYYVVTDSDLDLTNTPDDTLLYLQDCLIDSGLPKLGLMLDLEAVKPGMLYYDYLQWYEAGRRRTSPEINGIMTKLAVDTTFAMYRNEQRNYFVGGGSTMQPYQTVHVPWLYTRETLANDKEYQYYLQHANASASITSFLKDRTWVSELQS